MTAARVLLAVAISTLALGVGLGSPLVTALAMLPATIAFGLAAVEAKRVQR